MKLDKSQFIQCLVSGDDPESTAQAVSANAVRRLVIADLTDDDLRELGFAERPLEPASPALLPDLSEPDVSGTSQMIDATMRVIADQINNLGLEAEMLALRKRALKRRLRILERLSKTLQDREDNPNLE